MIAGPAVRNPRDGSILLPVIVVLLLIATAATAMTLQARSSLREAATRRDRLALGFVADAMVRSAAAALSEAIATHAQPPFAIDGTPQACGLSGGGGRLVMAVQDEGGLVDLNKASGDLLLLVLQRAGLSGQEAKASLDAILRRRDPDGATAGRMALPPGSDGGLYRTVDEIETLPGMNRDVLSRVLPALSVLNGSAGFDTLVAGPALKTLISPKEATEPAFADKLTPSAHNAFTLTGIAVSPQGMRVQRRAALQLPADGTSPRFVSWDAPISTEPLAGIPAGLFCARLAAALRPN